MMYRPTPLKPPLVKDGPVNIGKAVKRQRPQGLMLLPFIGMPQDMRNQASVNRIRAVGRTKLQERVEARSEALRSEMPPQFHTRSAAVSLNNAVLEQVYPSDAPLMHRKDGIRLPVVAQLELADGLVELCEDESIEADYDLWAPYAFDAILTGVYEVDTELLEYKPMTPGILPDSFNTLLVRNQDDLVKMSNDQKENARRGTHLKHGSRLFDGDRLAKELEEVFVSGTTSSGTRTKYIPQAARSARQSHRIGSGAPAEASPSGAVTQAPSGDSSALPPPVKRESDAKIAGDGQGSAGPAVATVVDATSGASSLAGAEQLFVFKTEEDGSAAERALKMPRDAAWSMGALTEAASPPRNDKDRRSRKMSAPSLIPLALNSHAPIKLTYTHKRGASKQLELPGPSKSPRHGSGEKHVTLHRASSSATTEASVNARYLRAGSSSFSSRPTELSELKYPPAASSSTNTASGVRRPSFIPPGSFFSHTGDIVEPGRVSHLTRTGGETYPAFSSAIGELDTHAALPDAFGGHSPGDHGSTAGREKGKRVRL